MNTRRRGEISSTMASETNLHPVQRKILREAGVLVIIWALIGGIASFLFFEETIKVVESWVSPLVTISAQHKDPSVISALQNVFNLLAGIQTYGTYIIVCLILVSCGLFWFSLREILKNNCLGRDSRENGEE